MLSLEMVPGCECRDSPSLREGDPVTLTGMVFDGGTFGYQSHYSGYVFCNKQVGKVRVRILNIDVMGYDPADITTIASIQVRGINNFDCSLLYLSPLFANAIYNNGDSSGYNCGYLGLTPPVPYYITIDASLHGLPLDAPFATFNMTYQIDREGCP